MLWSQIWGLCGASDKTEPKYCIRSANDIYRPTNCPSFGETVILCTAFRSKKEGQSLFLEISVMANSQKIMQILCRNLPSAFSLVYCDQFRLGNLTLILKVSQALF